MTTAEEITSRVKGFIEPIFKGVAPDGRTLNGISQGDWDLIRQGYACGDCLAVFHTYTIVCPVCGGTRDVLQDLPAPQDWLDHLHERENPTEHNQPQTFDEAVTGLQDVDTIPISKLRKRRR